MGEASWRYCANCGRTHPSTTAGCDAVTLTASRLVKLYDDHVRALDQAGHEGARMKKAAEAMEGGKQ